MQTGEGRARHDDIHRTMNGLHGVSAGLHGVQGFQIDIGIFNGHDLRLQRCNGAADFGQLIFVLFLPLQCKEGH